MAVKGSLMGVDEYLTWGSCAGQRLRGGGRTKDNSHRETHHDIPPPHSKRPRSLEIPNEAGYPVFPCAHVDVERGEIHGASSGHWLRDEPASEMPR